jgi:hypothetical protein
MKSFSSVRNLVLLLVLSVWLSACNIFKPAVIEPVPPVGKVSPDFMLASWAELPDWLNQELPA